MKKVEALYTDGSCLGSGAGGYGVIGLNKEGKVIYAY